ncbi:MAG: metal-dependent transcriptional regulator [Candidatus Bathyarchaeia archaeon]
MEGEETEISELAEEALEALWTGLEEGKDSSSILETIKASWGNGPVEELLRLGLIQMFNGRVEFTGEGRVQAEHTVRRHRLAERLLVDILDVKEKMVEDAACKFEHLLRDGVDESICILLGHPKVCPHGLPIPLGRCCHEAEKAAERVISPLSTLNSGEGGRIAYIHTKDRSRLQRLMAMGVLPGSPITLIQRSPAFVFQTGQTQIAVDDEIADAIYVRITKQLERHEPPHRGRRRLRFRFLRKANVHQTLEY